MLSTAIVAEVINRPLLTNDTLKQAVMLSV